MRELSESTMLRAKEWFTGNLLPMNSSKTSEIVFGLRSGCDDEMKFLVVHLDFGLICRRHIDELATKVNKNIFYLEAFPHQFR